ncbi:MAG: hypothetical protein IPL52_17845 [Flavobacteriales bacterium]|nr:hypothetical protein [Flavobacteriales bacterium]
MTLQNGASPDCTLPPVELLLFDARATGEAVELTWSTGSEVNERSFRAGTFARWIRLRAHRGSGGVGTSAQTTHYGHMDGTPYPGHQLLPAFAKWTMMAPARIRWCAVHTSCTRGAMSCSVPNPGSGRVDVLLRDPMSQGELLLLDATGRAVLRASGEHGRRSFRRQRRCRADYTAVVDTMMPMA